MHLFCMWFDHQSVCGSRVMHLFVHVIWHHQSVKGSASFLNVISSLVVAFLLHIGVEISRTALAYNSCHCW
jgi:cytosine/uracil/thiamine/allantoin permease